jgi:hypothetical protein
MCLDHQFDKLEGDTQQGVTLQIEPSSCWSCQDSATDATGWSGHLGGNEIPSPLAG